MSRTKPPAIEPHLFRRKDGKIRVQVRHLERRAGQACNMTRVCETLAEAREVRDAFLANRTAPPKKAGQPVRHPQWDVLCVLTGGKTAWRTYRGHNAGNAAQIALNRSDVIRVIKTQAPKAI